MSLSARSFWVRRNAVHIQVKTHTQPTSVAAFVEKLERLARRSTRRLKTPELVHSRTVEQHSDRKHQTETGVLFFLHFNSLSPPSSFLNHISLPVN